MSSRFTSINKGKGRADEFPGGEPMFLDGDGQARERFTAVLGDEVMEHIDSTCELSDEEEAGAGKGHDDGVSGTDDTDERDDEEEADAGKGHDDAVASKDDPDKQEDDDDDKDELDDSTAATVATTNKAARVLKIRPRNQPNEKYKDIAHPGTVSEILDLDDDYLFGETFLKVALERSHADIHNHVQTVGTKCSLSAVRHRQRKALMDRAKRNGTTYEKEFADYNNSRLASVYAPKQQKLNREAATASGAGIIASTSHGSTPPIVAGPSSAWSSIPLESAASSSTSAADTEAAMGTQVPRSTTGARNLGRFIPAAAFTQSLAPPSTTPHSDAPSRQSAAHSGPAMETQTVGSTSGTSNSGSSVPGTTPPRTSAPPSTPTGGVAHGGSMTYFSPSAAREVNAAASGAYNTSGPKLRDITLRPPPQVPMTLEYMNRTMDAFLHGPPLSETIAREYAIQEAERMALRNSGASGPSDPNTTPYTRADLLHNTRSVVGFYTAARKICRPDPEDELHPWIVHERWLHTPEQLRIEFLGLIYVIDCKIYETDSKKTRRMKDEVADKIYGALTTAHLEASGSFGQGKGVMWYAEGDEDDDDDDDNDNENEDDGGLGEEEQDDDEEDDNSGDDDGDNDDDDDDDDSDDDDDDDNAQSSDDGEGPRKKVKH